MAFKMKFSAGTPFHFHGGDPADHTASAGEIDPKKLKYKTTETATNLAGENIDTAGTAAVTVPGKEVERLAQPGTPEYDRWKAAVEKDPSIEDKYKDKEVKVTRERDYSQDVKPKKEKLYPNPYTNISYKRYGGTQESGGFNYKLKQAKIAGDSLTLKQVKELGKNVYGGGFYKMPGIAGWMQKNKLTYGKRKKPKTTPSSESESIGEYKYTIE